MLGCWRYKIYGCGKGYGYCVGSGTGDEWKGVWEVGVGRGVGMGAGVGTEWLVEGCGDNEVEEEELR